MPILRPEVDIYPSDLFDSAATSLATDAVDRRWNAVHAKPRQEKALARQLLDLRIPFYLPLVAKVNTIQGRKFKSLLPLFPGYLFLWGTPEEQSKARGAGRIVQLLPAPPMDQLNGTLRNIQLLINSGLDLAMETRLAPGQRVRVKNGSLMGVEGVVISRRGEDRLLVAVQFLQQGASVLIHDFQVEPI